jgi:hypothetical protein
MALQTEARNASLADLAELLTEQQARKVDFVAPASKITAVDGNIVVEGADVAITEDGVTQVDGIYSPTAVFDEGVALKLGIPRNYVKRMRQENIHLYDENVNGWLEQDTRSFMVRAFRGDDGIGIARALLSDSFGIMDNLDVLAAALDGIRDAGVDAPRISCDLTERKMYVRVVAPEVSTYASSLLDGYRNSRQTDAGTDFGYGPVEDPIVYAGLHLGNSETGGAAFSIVPRMVVKICNNGMKVSEDAVRSIHLGGKLDEGVVRWTADTESKQLALIKAKTRDAVSTFLDVGYMEKVIASLEQKAGKRIVDAAKTVETVTKQLQFPEEVRRSVLDHFIRGGQTTAGGVLQAVTAAAQDVADPDLADDMESNAIRALEHAYSL